MSISIYYEAFRELPLTPTERQAIAKLVDEFAVHKEVLAYAEGSCLYDWEDFCVYSTDDPTSPDAIFEGATRLPSNSEDAIWAGLKHWCCLLTQVRRVLPSARWSVHVDDHEIVWDESKREYDPSR